MWAANLVQTRARKWLSWLALHRESLKVTHRSQYGYASRTKPDYKAARKRREAVEGHGWRAPLNKEYQALGEPILDLEKRPVCAAAPAPAPAPAVPSEWEGGTLHSYVAPGESCRGSVPKFGFSYFATRHTDPKAHLVISVQSTEGDPDLFICREATHPNQQRHTWASDAMGDDTIEIRPDDPNLPPHSEGAMGQYNIAIYGGGGGARCHFTLSVKAYRPVGGKARLHKPYGHVERAAADARFVSERRLADGRRMRSRNGQSASRILSEEVTDDGLGLSPNQRLGLVEQLAAGFALPRGLAAGGTHPPGMALELLDSLEPRLAMALAGGFEDDEAAATEAAADEAGQQRPPPPGALVPGTNAAWVQEVLARCGPSLSLPAGAVVYAAGAPSTFAAIVLRGELVETDAPLDRFATSRRSSAASGGASGAPVRLADLPGGLPAAHAPAAAPAAARPMMRRDSSGSWSRHESTARRRGRLSLSLARAAPAAAPAAAPGEEGVHSFWPGCVVGEEPLLGKGTARLTSVVAAAPTDVLILPYASLVQLPKLEPEASEIAARLIAVCSSAYPQIGAAADAALDGGAANAASRAGYRQAMEQLGPAVVQIEARLSKLGDELPALADAEAAPAGAPAPAPAPAAGGAHASSLVGRSASSTTLVQPRLLAPLGSTHAQGLARAHSHSQLADHAARPAQSSPTGGKAGAVCFPSRGWSLGEKLATSGIFPHGHDGGSSEGGPSPPRRKTIRVGMAGGAGLARSLSAAALRGSAASGADGFFRRRDAQRRRRTSPAELAELDSHPDTPDASAGGYGGEPPAPAPRRTFSEAEAEYYTIIGESAVAAEIALSRPSGYALLARAKEERDAARAARRRPPAGGPKGSVALSDAKLGSRGSSRALDVAERPPNPSLSPQVSRGASRASHASHASRASRASVGSGGLARSASAATLGAARPALAGNRFSPARRSSNGADPSAKLSPIVLPSRMARQQAADKDAGAFRPRADVQEYKVKLRVSAFEQRMRELGRELREELDVIRDGRAELFSQKALAIDRHVAELAAAGPTYADAKGAMRKVRRAAAQLAAEQADAGDGDGDARCR